MKKPRETNQFRKVAKFLAAGQSAERRWPNGRIWRGVHEAYHTGYEACVQGEPRNANPYAAGSWNSDEWFAGWDAAAS